MTTFSPTVRRRRLSAALLQMRRDAGLDATEVARRLGWDGAKLSRIERNEWKRPKDEDVEALLKVYSPNGVVAESKRKAMLALAEQSRARGWWAAYSDVFRGSILPDLEAEATTIRTYESLVVPGLLQTLDYIEAIHRGWFDDEKYVARRVAGRLRRQEILDRVALCAVIDEAAVRKQIGGPDVMRDQLRHLVEMGSRPNITVRVVPDSAGAHAALAGSFVILEIEEDHSVVYLDTATESFCLDQPHEVDQYMRIYNRLGASALTPAQSAELISEMAERVDR
ncbi:helix-turn-helix domain-containing protein [Nonomuraea sp. NPDC050536]|uniref:helix-turn-helix domain-containing protein n=1 Tax=Nonomuraea sp. NPDC050536 TaxID=3364366 RepID=UPI0037CC4FB6